MATLIDATTQTVALVEHLERLYQPILDRVLRPDEHVCVAVNGLYHASVLAATDQRVIIIKDLGRQVFAVGLPEIVAIELHRPFGVFATNYVEVSVERGASDRDWDANPHRSPTCVPFSSAEKDQETFECAVAAIRELIHGTQRLQPVAAPQQPSVFAQVVRLGSLHRSGAITDEDFSSKKQELLAQI
jgi:hypothetical protein